LELKNELKTKGGNGIRPSEDLKYGFLIEGFYGLAILDLE
jgi:hypothetical protein